jgi:hypothetical protein
VADTDVVVHKGDNGEDNKEGINDITKDKDTVDSLQMGISENATSHVELPLAQEAHEDKGHRYATSASGGLPQAYPVPNAKTVPTVVMVPCLPSWQTRPRHTTPPSTPTTTSDSCDNFIQHVVLPTNTLAGLCLRYHVSRRDLQRANGCGWLSNDGDSLRLAPAILRIPITLKARQVGWQSQQQNDDFLLQITTLRAHAPCLSRKEAIW